MTGARESKTPIEAGVLVIDLATRRRLRVNGAAEPAADGGVLVRLRQVLCSPIRRDAFREV